MESKPDKEAWVASLTETMPLTALDYTAPQNYIMRCFIFPFPGTLDSEREVAVAYLRGKLARVLSYLPFLAGQIIHTREDEQPRLVYPGNGTHSNLELFPDEVFDHQVVDRSEFPWSFDELSALGVPAHTMIKSLFWLLPKTAPGPGDACHPVTLRASFIDGGLILGFSMHHGVMDGGGTVEFLKLFATDDELSGGSGGGGGGGIASLKQRKNNFIAFAARAAQTSPVNPLSMPGYDFAACSSSTTTTTTASSSASPSGPLVVAKVLTVSAATATALRAAVLAHLRTAHGPASFASTIDALCALVWVHVTRARVRAGGGRRGGLRVCPADVTRFATAVDLRGRGRLPTSVLALARARDGDEEEEKDEKEEDRGGGYLGNLFLRTLAGTTVRELVGLGDDDDGSLLSSCSLSKKEEEEEEKVEEQKTSGPRRATTAHIAEAAWRIRRAVAQMDDDPAAVEAHIAIAARATDAVVDAEAPARAGAGAGWRVAWPEVDAAVRRAIARHHAGLDASVGVHLGGDIEFAIPGVGGVVSGSSNNSRKTKAAWVRRACVPNEGAMALLPRRGGTKGDEDWEIWLALREEDMKVVVEPGELGGWLSRPPA
ncbi:hypothetical protein VTG60DRAFT_2142 [Thermothelomyces hinnuleus]